MPLLRSRSHSCSRLRLATLAATGLLGCLTGCQNLPTTHSKLKNQTHQPILTNSNSTSTDRNPAKITPAQEADVQIAFARAAEQQGDFEGAMAAYTQAIRKDQKRFDACIRLAILHDRLGQFKESDSLYRQALEMHPADPDIFSDMGYSFYLQRRWAEADRCLKQALAIKPDHPRAHNNLALLKVRDGRIDEALAEFRKGGGTPCQAHCNLAFALALEGRLDDAQGQYKLALTAEPNSPLAKEQLRKLEKLAARMTPDKPQQPGDPQLQQVQLVKPPTATVAAQPPTPLAGRSGAVAVSSDKLSTAKDTTTHAQTKPTLRSTKPSPAPASSSSQASTPKAGTPPVPRPAVLAKADQNSKTASTALKPREALPKAGSSTNTRAPQTAAKPVPPVTVAAKPTPARSTNPGTPTKPAAEQPVKTGNQTQPTVKTVAQQHTTKKPASSKPDPTERAIPQNGIASSQKKEQAELAIPTLYPPPH